MPSSIINSDDGVISGTSGLKTTGGDDGSLKIQANGTDAISIAADGTVALSAGALPVASGGTGATSLTANSVILGNGTSAVQTVAAGTNGNVLTSNGTTWVSQAISAGGDYVMQAFTSPGTWTKPAGLKAVKVTVVGGGGGADFNEAGGGGGGGAAIEYIDAPAIPGPVSVTVGSGGGGGTPNNPSASTGGTSSFGPFCSATGGIHPVRGSGAGGDGGSGSGGTVNLKGAAGFHKQFVDATINGNGGPSFMGGGGRGFIGPVLVAGTSGGSYGGGGGGGPPTSGGAGAGGVVLVEEFY